MAPKAHEPPDSWEDLEDHDADAGAGATHTHTNTLDVDLWSPSPSEIGRHPLEAPCANGAWRVAYTSHPGRFEDPVVSDDLGELLRDPAGRKLRAALVTSFWPFELNFLKRLPLDIDLTVCLGQDRVLGEKQKVPRRLFGIELSDVEQLDAHGAIRARSSHCPRCFPRTNPVRCSTEFFVRPCKCPQQGQRHIQWLLTQLQGTSIMHVKLMLLRFEGFVRLVISSLNLSDTQWAHAGDSFWWADLPFRADANARPDAHVQEPLVDMLVRMHVPAGWLRLLACCDWPSLQQQGTNIYAVTSIPGAEDGRVTYGMERLGRLLRGMPTFPPSREAPVYIQVWSLGSSGDKWYTDFALVLTQERFRDLGVIAQWKHDHCRFIFQRDGGGPNWHEINHTKMQRENRVRNMLGIELRAARRSELKKVLWDENASALLQPRKDRPPVPWGWHSKVMTRVYPPGFCLNPGCNRTHGWRYLGSHNCSRASWGWRPYCLEKHISVMDPPNNWELGVLIISSPARVENETCGVDLDVCAPLPFKPDGIHRLHPEC